MSVRIFSSLRCCEYNQPGHPESPARVQDTYSYLQQKGFEFVEPAPCLRRDVLRVHTPELFEMVRMGNFSDSDTPALSHIFDYAMLAAGSAIEAAHVSLQGARTFSLMRPPGHHAGRDTRGGFCYFNAIAIAIENIGDQERKRGIVDLDCHHGNGTQDIFLGRDDVIYISLHQSPLYPGTGLCSEKNCYNYPLSAATSTAAYLQKLTSALARLESFNPDVIGVSMGFDTYERDPLTGLGLPQSAYYAIGCQLAHLRKPVFVVLEGGYHIADLPENTYQFLRGLAS